MFGEKAKNSFSSLADNSTESFLNKSGQNSSAFDFLPKSTSFLSAATNQSVTNDQDEAVPEEFKPDDSQFKRPEIALSEPVELKTGEENEVVLFSASVDLYRFVSGSGAKKRGSGEIKILKNVETGKFRCVMRREQILNVCANFAISPGFEVLSTKMGDNVLSWLCKDFSDLTKDGEIMTLICRFKNVETAEEFKSVVAKITSA